MSAFSATAFSTYAFADTAWDFCAAVVKAVAEALSGGYDSNITWGNRHFRLLPKKQQAQIIERVAYEADMRHDGPPLASIQSQFVKLEIPVDSDLIERAMSRYREAVDEEEAIILLAAI